MKIFVDANILIAVLNKEYPLFSNAARILSQNNKNNIRIYTSPLCLAIAFYFASKKSNESIAKNKIDLLCQNISITTMNEKLSLQAVQDVKIHDFKDGLEYYSALHHSCDYIVTEDLQDFYFSKIPVVNSEKFLFECIK